MWSAQMVHLLIAGFNWISFIFIFFRRSVGREFEGMGRLELWNRILERDFHVRLSYDLES